MDFNDDRKIFFLELICTFFNKQKEKEIKNVFANSSVSQFIDDVSCSFLRVHSSEDNCTFSNELPNTDDSDAKNYLIFFKLKPEILTEETVKTSVFVMTLFDSPILTFHQALNNFYIPVLLNDNFGQEPKIQNTLKALDGLLKYALHQSNSTESLATNILNEELRYWESVSELGERSREKKVANSIMKILSTVQDDLSSLNSTISVDVEEVIESCITVLDDLWRMESGSYDEKRIKNLIDMIGNSIVLHIQKKIDSIDIWKEDYELITDILNSGISACTKWNDSLRTLCTVYWSSSNDRRWSGEPYSHNLCSKLKIRLQEIKNVRSAHRQLTRLLSSSEQKELATNSSFSFFEGLKPNICSPYTESLWKGALQQYEKSLVSIEQRVAIKLKSQLNHLNANTLQLLQEIKRYQELIKRPNIAQHLMVERQKLLGILQEYVDELSIDSEEDFPQLDLPPTVKKIYRTRLLHSKVEEINDTNNEILKDLQGSESLSNKCISFLSQLRNSEKEQFDNWIHEVKDDIKIKGLSLSETSKVLHLKSEKMVEVNYPVRLVRLVREVQHLSAMGLNIPKSIKEITERALKFMNQAKQLEKIANFHNTIGDRIISSQKPMLLPAAQKLDSLINSQQTVTWSDTAAVDKYIANLQEVVTRLSQEINKLAFYHQKITDKVVSLLNYDLTRQQSTWKQTLRDIREIITQVEFSKFPNTKSWKIHWDYQLYKALEWQYKLSLCNLHLHFPEIKVELIYRQQKLQFHPPLEEIRMKYYSQVKRFLSIPNSFTGILENTQPLYSKIVSRNASQFHDVFVEAENLFSRLIKIKNDWSCWMALGSINLEQLAEENLKEAEDWDLNFRASKKVGQEVAKLHYNDEKVGCITVSALPIRAEIELHNRKYWDALTMSLQTSIVRDINNLNKYIADATEILNAQPKTMSEVGEANLKHTKLVESSAEMQKAFESTIKKNKVLASWTKEKIELVNQLIFSWDNFQNNLRNHKFLIARQVERMKIALKGETENLLSDIEKFNLRWDVQKPKDTDIQDADLEVLKKNIILVKEKIEEWNELKTKKEKLEDECKKFEMPEPQLMEFEHTNDDLQKQYSTWSFFNDFYTDLEVLSKEEWILFRGKAYKFEEFLLNWEKLTEEKVASPVIVRMLQEINSYKAMIPLFKYLRGEMFSDKHWLELFMILGMENKSPESLVLGDFLAVKDKISLSSQSLQTLNTEAASEITIRQALGELDAWEVQARFTLILHNDSKGNSIMLIKDYSDILNKIGDNQCLLQSIINSSNAKSFFDRTSMWESKLIDLDEFVGNLNIMQRKWVYLEPIFRNGSFAMEQNRFERVDQDFRYIMNEVSKDNRVMALLRIVNLRQILNMSLDQLNRCQNCLNQYLQEKRSIFPRFYFLGDDDLLELIGQSTKEQVIQTHLKKLFSGINSVIMNEGYIKGIKSLQEETVQLNSPVKVTACVEEWLNALNLEVQKTLKSLLLKCIAEKNTNNLDPVKFPSQILSLGESLWFTAKCEENISNGKLLEFYNSIKTKLNSYSESLEDWQDGDNLLRLKLKTLLSDTVLHMDIIEALLEHQVSNTNDWYWQKQLRFYITPKKNVLIKMADAELDYTYEYQGNGPKLVRTPLTEKCFLTLTQAMKMGLGGNPFGPAGTGKTESVKALGALLGRQVLVFNCDKGIDVKSMGRIFVGLVKCGAWGCFDEFNRLEEATLSAVSMIIQSIQIALQENKKTVRILDEEVSINPNCGLFVTLNPAGKNYGGRKKLPNNLKQLFRPVVMSVPDEKLIAQISLLTEGFKEAKIIGAKLFEVFDLAKNLLSMQQHYDWGLRALKTVLGSCGSLFKQNNRKTEEEKSSELEIAVEAVRLNTLSKLTFKDSILFDKIVKDVFVGVKFIDSEFEKLTAALKDSFESLGLHYNENQVKKCIELYEQMQQRMGVALVGPSGTGKTTILKLLKSALQKLGFSVKQYTLNPKSMPRTQFFGQVDVDTRQWNDGVLTVSALKLCSENSDVLSWLVCDGDVDPDWVEALNSVLDDNRLLTLPSGWRIQFGSNVNFLFETSELNYASPATVSRMGIIFLSNQIIDVSIIVESWLTAQSEKYRHFLEPLISDYFFKSIEWIQRKGSIVVPYSKIGLVNSGLSHLVNIQSKSQFIMALIYGLGANLTAESRQSFAENVFESAGEFVPDPSKILTCYYNKERNRIDELPIEISSNEKAEQFGWVLTPSAKTSFYVLEPWINSYQPIIICGPEGSGKTLLVNYCLSKQPASEVATIFCSELVSPQHLIQKLRQFCSVTTSSSGRVLKPKNSQKVVLFLKNLELAIPDDWGTNMLITWLQQVVSCQGFYESDLEWTSLEQIQIIGTLAYDSQYPSVRLTSITRIYYLNPPSADDLKAIYSVHVKSVILKSFEKYKAWTTPSKITSLVATLISIYEKVQSTFTKIKQNHYTFCPRDLTRWCSEIQRYKINFTDQINSLLEVVTYVGFRLFCDRFVTDEDRDAFKEIMCRVMENEWNYREVVVGIEDVYFVSDESEKYLVKSEKRDWTEIINKGIRMSLGQENEILVIDELLRLTSSVDRLFSASNTSLILAGRSGVGRKTALRIISSLRSARLFTLNVSHNYNIKTFKADLKTALQYAGVDGEIVYLLIEDYQITDTTFLHVLSSLLSSGEIPGLYSSDELESVISSLRDVSAAEGYSGSTVSFFASRVLKNLHVALVLDSDRTFKYITENNSRLFFKCEIIWLPEWSAATMKHIPKILYSKIDTLEEIDSLSEICKFIFEIHKEFINDSGTPRRFLAFVKTYIKIFLSKKKSIAERAEGLKAGITKLNETKIVVDKLKKEAASQKEKLAEKQLEASSALNLIGETMRNANAHKEEMEKLREQAVMESKQLTERKKAIDQELSEVKPLIEEARQAVGNIKSESLSEIRSLRVPPDVIRDILEGVLRLMGIQDTSWNNMKNFLAKRGVKEDIRTFDAHQISADSKEAVNLLLMERNDSFDPKVAKRASVAAAPLAAWVKANIKYAMVLDKIRPLEKEQRTLQQNLSNIEGQVGNISTGLGEVDEKVNELKNRLNTYTREAAVIEIHLSKAEETMASAKELLAKLEDEYERWTLQLNDLTNAMNHLPWNTLIGAAFLTYLSTTSENTRKSKLDEWEKKVGGIKFSLMDFLTSEQDKLKWISEGLSSDKLSFENAVIMLESWFHPLLIDPSGMALNWLKHHFSGKNLEVISQHHPKLQTTVELAVRFGKTLIVEEVENIHAVLIPLLRKDIIYQGPRQIIYVGEKPVDYNKDFKLFLITRNTEIQAPSDATTISFTVTEEGLADQLLSLAVEQEKPELGARRNELLKREEEMKLKLYSLQENLLEQLASAQGDILSNKDLINSLNQTKTSSEEISKALKESEKLESELDKEFQSYKAISEFGSRLFFTIKSLSSVNSMYQFSVTSFKKLFKKSLKLDYVNTNTNITQQKTNLIRVSYHYVSRSLFNSDRLAFALRLFFNMYPEKVVLDEWSVFKGECIVESQIDFRLKESLPSWVDEDRLFDINVLRNALPDLFLSFKMFEINDWLNFSGSQECEKDIPRNLKSKLSPFQILLIIQAFRPDRLYSAMTQFVLNALDIKTLSPSSISLVHIAEETTSTEPILLLVSPGADPSEELRLLAKTLPNITLREVAMGEGQKEVALNFLKKCSENGDWLCLKNLHLMGNWLGDLEKVIKSLKPHSDFRLWLTTEPHDDFNKVLSSSCLKVTYEAPPGIKKNLQRTYGSWKSDTFRKKGIMFGRTMFAAAWFHAVVQERRVFIPQGWSIFYEFSDSDLRATVDLITRVFLEGSFSINWTFIQGLLLHAIYGGRMDNKFDIEVLGAYLHEYFNENTLNKGSDFGPALTLPSSESFSEYLQLIHQLSDFDKPIFFGLPENIERSWQKKKSLQTIEQLKVLEHSTKILNFDINNWQQNLSPLLTLWKKLNQSVGLIEIKLSDKIFDKICEDPVLEFIRKDFEYGMRVVQIVHQTLAGINKVIRSVALADAETVSAAKSLINHQTPCKWQTLWEGSDNPFKYVSAIFNKTVTLQKMTEVTSSEVLFEDDLDLAAFFQPNRFLKAFKQASARKSKVPLDKMELQCKWLERKRTSSATVRIKNLQLEGATFDGRIFSHTTIESSIVITAPSVTIFYIDRDSIEFQHRKDEMIFPVYQTSKRENLLMTLSVPCSGNKNEWYKTGAAFFLRE